MKLVALIALFGCVSLAACGGMHGGPMGMIVDTMMGPPHTLDECMDRMKIKMDMKIAMMEEMFSAKWDCKDKCLSDDAKKCLPAEAFKQKLNEEHAKLKKEFLEVKEKARICIKEQVAKGGCSDTPMHMGMCGFGIAKKLVGKEAKQCVGGCMKEKMEAKFMAFATANAGKNGFPKMEEMAKFKDMIKAKMEKHKGKGKMMKKMMMHKMKGMCVMQFCKVDALLECAKSSGLEEMYKKKKMAKANIMNMMEAEMFPKACECLKKTAKDLPEYLKSFSCEKKYNAEVCDQLHLEHLEHVSKKLEEMKEKEVAARRKREAVQLFSLEDEEEDELDHLDGLDFE